MLERIAGNEELKSSIRRMLEGRRLTHSVLLVGEAGLGAGFAARCVAADYLYPRRSSTPAFRQRAVPSCSTMWSG